MKKERIGSMFMLSGNKEDTQETVNLSHLFSLTFLFTGAHTCLVVVIPYPTQAKAVQII